ncbi:MAG TPA: type IV secretion system protein, partial [Streptosporangiaceae bacterium]
MVVAGVLGSPAIAQAAVGAIGSPASHAQHASLAGRAATAAPASTAHQASPAKLTAVTQPAGPGGVCGVPGIGDIGGLLGFCNAGSSGLIGDLNNICQPSVAAPEPANGGIDSLIKPPATGGKPTPTLYDSYGMAGQSWNAYDMQCSDMTSLIGNSVAGMVFDAAKALDRVTITVYQSAAGEGILSWLTNSVDRLITSLGNAIYFPYLAPVVILGALWLAWQGLIRKRATRTIEGTVWMVIAATAAIWLIARPADFTGMGKTVSDGITQTLNVAFAGLPAPAESNCVPVGGNDPQVKMASFSYTGGSSIVDQNANELWTVLVCKPWLDGEFGTTVYTTGQGAKPTVVNQYGRQLLWSQAIAANENATPSLITAKENTYAGIAAAIKQNDPAVYSLFQGNQYPTRLEIAFASLFAALVAGVLVLLIAITLIILKLGFLLLLVAGPFFLIVGTHPGFGRVVALRWFEMLIGVLLKQAAIALVLSVLLYAYSLIMGTSDATLPWALKILMIALVTVAVFIYRKPFVHLFSAVGYGMVGSRDRGDKELSRAGDLARQNTVDAATVGVPG